MRQRNVATKKFKIQLFSVPLQCFPRRRIDSAANRLTQNRTEGAGNDRGGKGGERGWQVKQKRILTTCQSWTRKSGRLSWAPEATKGERGADCKHTHTYINIYIYFVPPLVYTYIDQTLRQLRQKTWYNVPQGPLNHPLPLLSATVWTNAGLSFHLCALCLFRLLAKPPLTSSPPTS